MTNPEDTPVAADQTPETAPSAADASAPNRAGEPSEESSREAHRDAIKYRTQLREAEARIERMQRAEIERLASSRLSHADDLFNLSGNAVADYLTEAGDVDPDKVAADIAEILAERPGLRRPAPAADRSQGFGANAETKPSWDDLLRPDN
ncbi:hypothetical protein B7435_23675 [Mycolicibacterium peregrinum]|uniref:hypothetical protein n=1 Tax=Mycolicibacterium peregrinum TaxID=43304 RepID=UPI000B4BDF4C|nr:hypothetical protein [Mycolicibacterium peregrinum]MCP3811381.1 hypothetical protein [Mycobacteriaceae bacterium Msp059]OWL98898.1 hypothetical protein B7435_23675 [Mycolicibacterium peregrinum]